MVKEFWIKKVEEMTERTCIWNISINSQRIILENQVVDGKIEIQIIELQVARDNTKWKEMHPWTITMILMTMSIQLEAEFEGFQCQEVQFHTLEPKQEQMSTADLENKEVGDNQTTTSKTNMQSILEVVKVIMFVTKQFATIKNISAMKNHCRVNKQQSLCGGDD